MGQLSDTLQIKGCIPEAHFCYRYAIKRVQEPVFATKRLVREYDGAGVDVFRQVIEDLENHTQSNIHMSGDHTGVDTLESKVGN